MSMINDLRAKREALLSTLEATVMAGVEEERELTEAEEANVEATKSEIEKLDARINQLVEIQERRAADAELSSKAGVEAGTVRVNEGELYREDGEYNFVSDVIAAQLGNNSEARTRLEKHNEQHRATVSSDLGGFVIPQHAVGDAALTLTEGRPFANIVPTRPLNSLSVVIPRQSGSTAVSAQNGENTSGGNADFKADDDLVINAKTITGYTDISRQSLDLSSLDTATVVGDLVKVYNEELDRQLLVGTGNNGEIGGLFTMHSPGATGTFTDVQDIWNAVGQAKIAVRRGVKANATHLVVTPELWGYIEHATDEDGRPLFGFSYSAPQNVVGQGAEAYTFNGLRVVVDSFVPFSSAEEDNEQSMAVVKADELRLYEQGPRSLTVDQTLAHTGTVRFVIFGYAAFTSERRPAAVQTFEGIPDLSLI